MTNWQAMTNSICILFIIFSCFAEVGDSVQG